MALIINSGARQYSVTPAQKIIVNRIIGEIGDIIPLGLIHAYGDDKDVNEVFGKIIGHQRGEKVIVTKYKPKSNYRRRYGPRQEETILEITLTNTSVSKPTAKKVTTPKVVEPKIIKAEKTETKKVAVKKTTKKTETK